jgi:glucose/arabinose dehydrogenase
MFGRSLVPAALAALIAGAAFSQSEVPYGFADEVYSSGLSYPIALAFLPDGRLLCAEKGGAIKVVKTDGTSATCGVVANVTASSDRGLQGIALDPQWPTRPYVYAYYTTSSPSAHVQLSMFTMTGDLTNASSTNLVLGTIHPILGTIADQAPEHQGGTIAFGPDGKLYVFVGDDMQICLAQNLGSLLGKVLRLDVSALPVAGPSPPALSVITPAGNPFTGPTPNGPLIWAYGLRNPFRADIDPVTGTIFIADVGDLTWEELDVCATSGLNFGWPNYEGNVPYPYAAGCTTPPPNPTFPIIQHHHLTGTHSIVTLAVYRNPATPGPSAFGPAYEGDVFYADYFDCKIRRLHQTGTTWALAPVVPGQPEFEAWAYTEAAGITDGVVGPDGALYYTQLVSGNIRRIRAGAPPGPTFGAATPSAGVLQVSPGSPVTFTVNAIAPPGPTSSVTLSVNGIPPTATLNPPLPSTGATAQTAFTWTPSFFETGMWTMMFTATDQSGFVRTTTVSVYVTDSILAVTASVIADRTSC